MKVIKIFSNVNPLSPNVFLEVAVSSAYSCSVETFETDVLPVLVDKLFSQGFQVSIQETFTTTQSYLSFIKSKK